MPELQIAEVIDLFNKAFQIRDVSILKDLISENCVMEGAMPPPEGSRVEGFADCYKFWESLINIPDTQFTPENVFVMGEKAIIQWRFSWGKELENYVRGVNLMTVKLGKITEALGYVKGNLAI